MGSLKFIVQYEVIIRLSFFLGIFALIAFWELMAQRRLLSVSKWLRWSNNLGLVVLNSVVLRFIFPAAAVGVVIWAKENGWGLFNYIDLNLVLATILSVVILDLAIYLQHILVHAVPVLWRFHKVHHADMDIDVTTGARFHTLEIIFSMLIKFAIILLIGPPVVAVIIFEVVLNGMAMFNHGNINISKKLDTLLRWFVVTPDMHRVHHSIEEDETNSNFGFNLSCWDRLFGTYREQPRSGHIGMTIGLREYRDSSQTSWLPRMLFIPFVKSDQKVVK